MLFRSDGMKQAGIPNDKNVYVDGGIIRTDPSKKQITLDKADFNSSSIVGEVEKGDVFTITQKIERTGTDMYKLKSGVYITASTKYVEIFEK